MSRRQLRKSNGQWRKASLTDFGIKDSELQEGKAVCAHCNHKWYPILKTGKCPSCGSADKADEQV